MLRPLLSVSPAVRLAGFALAAVMWAACGNSGSTPATEVTGGTTTVDPTALLGTPGPIGTALAGVPAGAQTRRLALAEGGVLVVQEPNGDRLELAQFEVVPGGLAFPAWSPDGQWIAFARRSFFTGRPEPDWGDDLFVVSAAGGEPRLVREHAMRGEQISGISWRPDGQRLVLGRIAVEIENGIPVRIESATIVELDVASGGERVVLDGGYDPSLSADGTRLAYVRLEEIIGASTVMVANGDGSDPIALVSSDSFEVLRYPRIAPDGRTVAVTGASSFVVASEPAGRGWLAALLGPLVPRRAEAHGIPRSAGAHGIPMDIWLADSATGELRQLTAIGEDDPYLGWSADGETVIFIGTNGLYEVSVSDGSLIRTGEGRFDGQLAVAPG